MAGIAPYMERLIFEAGPWYPYTTENVAPYHDDEPSLADRFTNWQNGSLDVEIITTPVRNLPDGLAGYRVAIVSDIHLYKRITRGEELLRSLTSVKPDLIALLGDMVDGRSKTADPYCLFFKALASVAPCLAVMGNNDYVCGHLGALRAYYMEAGIPLLEDESRIIHHGGARLRCIGLQDANAFAYHCPVPRDLSHPHVKAIQASRDSDMIDMLLIHRPHRAARTVAMGGFALALSGHAHGGQWRLMGRYGLFAPGQGIWPKYTSGLYETGGGHMVLSRGISNHGFPIRLGNRPHLPVVELVGGQGTR